MRAHPDQRRLAHDSTLPYFLFIGGGMLLFSLVFLSLRRSPRTEGSSSALVDARQALNSLQAGLLPADLVHRIFAKDDLEYVRSEAPVHVQEMFYRERNIITLAWVSQMRSQIRLSDALPSGLGALLRRIEHENRNGTGHGLRYCAVRMPVTAGAPVFLRSLYSTWDCRQDGQRREPHMQDIGRLSFFPEFSSTECVSGPKHWLCIAIGDRDCDSTGHTNGRRGRGAGPAPPDALGHSEVAGSHDLPRVHEGLQLCTGLYYHDGLASRFTQEVACEALADCHREAYPQLVGFSLENLVCQMEAA